MEERDFIWGGRLGGVFIRGVGFIVEVVFKFFFFLFW